MISTPYLDLRRELRKPEGWQPAWATRLERRHIDGESAYCANPDRLTSADLHELATLEHAGWHIIIDAPRINRLRITLWR